MDNIKNRHHIEKSFATEWRVIVRERKVNTEGGQTNRICLSTLRKLFRKSWEVSEAHNEMKHAFINAQSNAVFSLEACVALCIHNTHLTVTRVLGANIHDIRQDGSKLNQTHEGRQKSPIMRTSMRSTLLVHTGSIKERGQQRAALLKIITRHPPR